MFAGARPHDVAPAPDGSVWFTAQGAGEMGRLDPRTGEVRRVKLGAGSAPHGVIIGLDEAAWITDGGLNAITSAGTVWYSSLAGSHIARVSADGSLKTVAPPTAGAGARRVWPDSRGRPTASG